MQLLTIAKRTRLLLSVDTKKMARIISGHDTYQYLQVQSFILYHSDI